MRREEGKMSSVGLASTTLFGAGLGRVYFLLPAKLFCNLPASQRHTRKAVTILGKRFHMQAAFTPPLTELKTEGSTSLTLIRSHASRFLVQSIRMVVDHAPGWTLL